MPIEIIDCGLIWEPANLKVTQPIDLALAAFEVASLAERSTDA